MKWAVRRHALHHLDGRTPHGVRGLKYRIADGRAVGRRSHPSRGAWIEMMLMVEQFDAALVAPLTGCVD